MRVGPALSALCISLLSLACAPATAAPASAAKTSQWFAWDHDPKATSALSADGLTLTATAKVDARHGMTTPVLTIKSRSGRPFTFTGAEAGSTVNAEAQVLRLDRDGAGPVVLFRSYTGGAHCCLEYKIATERAGRWTVATLGQWDGAAAPEPEDVDGDGQLELVSADQRFLYRFDSYAGSIAPPVIYELRAGKLVDVSDQPRYRAAFRRKLDEYRGYCDGEAPFGACAGYVATAARAGEADAAFDRLDAKTGSITGYGPWILPVHCGGSPANSGCATDKPERTFARYRDAVQWFLEDLGYLPKMGG